MDKVRSSPRSSPRRVCAPRRVYARLERKAERAEVPETGAPGGIEMGAEVVEVIQPRGGAVADLVRGAGDVEVPQPGGGAVADLVLGAGIAEVPQPRGRVIVVISPGVGRARVLRPEPAAQEIPRRGAELNENQRPRARDQEAA